MGNLRIVIAVLGGLLVLLSMPPVRRRLPVLGHCPAWLELLLWSGLLTACLLALDKVQSARSAMLIQAIVRAALIITSQALDSVITSIDDWLTAHEVLVALVIAAALAICLFGVLAMSVEALRRPKPRLGDWWPVRVRPANARRLAQHPAFAIPAVDLVDVQEAANYLGVSRSSIYRRVRSGQLRGTRTRYGMRFSSGELTRLREGRARRGAVRQSRPAA